MRIADVERKSITTCDHACIHQQTVSERPLETNSNGVIKYVCVNQREETVRVVRPFRVAVKLIGSSIEPCTCVLYDLTNRENCKKLRPAHMLSIGLSKFRTRTDLTRLRISDTEILAVKVVFFIAGVVHDLDRGAILHDFEYLGY